jgi:hypothetical protein
MRYRQRPTLSRNVLRAAHSAPAQVVSDLRRSANHFMHTTLVLLFFAALLFPFIGSLVWISRDAKLRGKPGLLVASLAAVLAWPISLLVWIALRPAPQLWTKDLR